MHTVHRLALCLLAALALPASAARPGDVVYAAAVNPCLISEPGGQTGQRLRNLCNFRINITFCQVKRDGDDCAAGRIGGTAMAGHSSRSLLEDVVETHYVVCRAPFQVAVATAAWRDGRVLGRCQATRAAAQAAKPH